MLTWSYAVKCRSCSPARVMLCSQVERRKTAFSVLSCGDALKCVRQLAGSGTVQLQSQTRGRRDLFSRSTQGGEQPFCL